MPSADRPSTVAQPPLTTLHMWAIKALAKGEATPEQQRSALDYVLHVLAQVDLVSFRTEAQGGARETDVAEGKRFVGLHLRRIILLTPEELLKEEAMKGNRA